MNKWKHKGLAAQMYGVTPDTLQNWLTKKMVKGLHYAVVGHQTMVNVEEVDKWLTEFGLSALGQADADFESESTKARNAFTRKRSGATPTPKLISNRS